MSNTNTIDGINTKIKTIKGDIKTIEKKNKSFGKTLLQQQSQIDRNNTAIETKNNELNKYSDKLTIIKNKHNKVKKIKN